MNSPAARGRGRPPLPESERAAYTVRLRFTPKDGERIERAAELAGATVAEFLRVLVLSDLPTWLQSDD